MKLLCVNPHGELEIWEKQITQSIIRTWFIIQDDRYLPWMYTEMDSTYRRYEPEFWGREIIEEWRE